MTVSLDLLELELTLRCNLHCANCDRMAPAAVDIDFSHIVKLAARGASRWRRVRLIGGEPLLYPLLDDVFELLYDFPLEVATNGTIERALPFHVRVMSSDKSIERLPLFNTFNVAPCDLTEYREHNWEMCAGCEISSLCGMALSVDGLYYPCGAGATICRWFGLNIGQKDPLDVGSWMFSHLCKYCGHYKYSGLNDMNNRTRIQTYSESWMRVLK